ncbi:UxaA family hydrolase [Sphingomonas nostoxanthinifaciens]|uniref:UxaA family hydrolase n=1 Tax=Sphingomonas nostoxanthinifaciens TaxID=2872652 RepID=UPI001CC1C32A|nr:altronate dehydratase family protein [Sphingomonas nostoxanthinifaciens]UAK26098.1 altronate dehydratase family protein [Sphingomonas nostoxanthinifaciens]
MESTELIERIPALVQVAPGDHVAVTLRAITAGETLKAGGQSVVAAVDIPRGHKIALVPVAAGDDVRRYGWPIGRATAAIAPGDHVHSHNLATKLSGEEPYRYTPAAVAAPSLAAGARGFAGYRRADGTVGTRNQLWVIPTVGCVARTAQRVAADAARRLGGSVDGVLALAHPFGCSQLGDDLDKTAAILASLACHPNAGGVLLLGLGCEENQLAPLLERLPPERRDRVRTLGAQMSLDEDEEAARALDALAEIAAADRREQVGLGALRLGLKCGGSDGLSGITANPLIGRAADAVVDAGGAALLTEIPEMFGAERLLMARATDEAVFDRLVALVNGFKRYFLDHGEPISENPSPGNVAGGITTLEEKSLGAVQKGGHAAVADVLLYGERLRRTGLTVLEAPGNDAVSITALAAAGATLTLFSTGRGTPLGSPVPTMKLATNHALAERKPGWIDFDAGSVLDDGLDATTAALLDRICEIASGEPARNEVNEEREIAIWKRGVTL